MNVFEKLPRTKPYIDSIADHTDEDAAIRTAALVELKMYIDTKIAQIGTETAARIAGLSITEG